MKKAIFSLLAALAVAPMAANAELIEYTFEGDSVVGWSVSGSVFIDEADIVTGTSLAGDFASWAFSWTNGVDTLANSSDTHTFAPFAADFFVDAALNVIDVTLCTGACEGNQTDWPEILIFVDSWSASITPEGNCCVASEAIPTGAWSGPSRVAVPEPGTLALLGAGLLLAGFARRRRQT